MDIRGIAVFMAYTAYSYKKLWVIFPFCVIAVSFNPIFIIYSEKMIWQFIDVICGITFVASIFLLRKVSIKNMTNDL